jgi:Holliday junction resolvasome RuvABC endonuclease subunit
MQIVGIDPGTGSTSPLGVVTVDFTDRSIKGYAEYWSDGGNATARIRDIASHMCKDWPEVVDIVAVEYFVMRGKGGETLARMVGAVLGCLPPLSQYVEVQNSTLKKFVGGHGAASKEEVAEGVLEYFMINDNSLALVTEFVLEERWDLVDALAIAITAYETRKTEE